MLELDPDHGSQHPADGVARVLHQSGYTAQLYTARVPILYFNTLR
jgi:hypothetical protein